CSASRLSGSAARSMLRRFSTSSRTMRGSCQPRIGSLTPGAIFTLKLTDPSSEVHTLAAPQRRYAGIDLFPVGERPPRLELHRQTLHLCPSSAESGSVVNG